MIEVRLRRTETPLTLRRTDFAPDIFGGAARRSLLSFIRGEVWWTVEDLNL